MIWSLARPDHASQRPSYPARKQRERVKQKCVWGGGGGDGRGGRWTDRERVSVYETEMKIATQTYAGRTITDGERNRLRQKEARGLRLSERRDIRTETQNTRTY